MMMIDMIYMMMVTMLLLPFDPHPFLSTPHSTALD